VEHEIKRYLLDQGFRETPEGVWKKGMGLMLGPQFIRFETKPGSTHLEAWIKFALLPGIYMGEMGITGAFAFIPKKKLRSRVEAIERIITGKP
jgi:hypothetical protein